MKYMIIFVLLSSCSPFISKDLRRKNKCNKKLERVIRKCPELINKDTLTVNVIDTFLTKEVKVDTLFNINFDTINIVKDNFRLKLIRTTDTLLIDGGCLTDTIYIDKVLRVPYKSVKAIQLTIFEQIMNVLSRLWYWLIVVIIICVVWMIFKR